MTQRRRANSPSDPPDASGQPSGRRRRVRPTVDDAEERRRRRRVRPSIGGTGRGRRRAARDEPGEPPPTTSPAGEGAEPTGTRDTDTEPTGTRDEGVVATSPAATHEGEADQRAAAASRDTPGVTSPAWWHRPVLRAGAYAWALIGLLAIAVAVGMAAGALRVVVVPLLLALFPAALLYPVCQALRRWGVPPALAALLTILGVLVLLAGIGTALAPQVADEIPNIVDEVQDGVREVENFLDTTAPFGIDTAEVRAQFDEAVNQIDTQAAADAVRTGALGAAAAVAEVAVMTLLLLVVLFFYLKDGSRLGRWLCALFPGTARTDAEAVGLRAWTTIGAYFRGQLVVALVDGLGIGIGLWVLGVPLALPLAVLVFFGGLFPIVGAVVTGILAVLVALATTGPVVALVVLGLVVAVQQLESNVVAPYVLSRVTALHPLAVLTVITAGAVLLGMLGAFLAVPVAASITRGVGTLRERWRERRAPSPAAVASADP